MKFEYFSERARRVMLVAEQEARAFKHQYVGTEHVLLGLLSDGSDVVTNLFETLGVDAEKVRAEIEKLLPEGPVPIGAGELPLTPRAKEAIEYARREVGCLGLKSVDAEHLLLGLVYEPGGVAGKVLRNLGVELQLIGPAVFRLRLEQMKIVERVVRPVRAGVPRKRKMREELLAHLTVIYEQEMERLNDSRAAITEAARRFGDPEELSLELEKSLPISERISYQVERYVGWRAPESAERYMLRLALLTFGLLAVTFGPVIGWMLWRIGMEDPAYWVMYRVELVIWLGSPVGVFVLGILYFKMRNAMWGAWGARRSGKKTVGYSVLIAAMMAIFVLGFLAVEQWDLQILRLWVWRSLGMSVYGGVVYGLIAYSRGPTEIRDALWASLKVD